MISTSSNTCLTCGAPLKIWRSEETKTCDICGRKHVDIIWCPNGHYICEVCSTNPSVAHIRSVCKSSNSKNPIEIALTLLNSPIINEKDSAYHIFTAAALLTAYKNCGGKIDCKEALEEAIKFSMGIPSKVCTFAGVCGTAMSVGVFYSVVAGTDPSSANEWRKGNELVSECLQKIYANGRTRCCTRGVLSSTEMGAQYSKELFGVELELPEKIVCDYSPKNRHCIKKLCPYYSP